MGDTDKKFATQAKRQRHLGYYVQPAFPKDIVLSLSSGGTCESPEPWSSLLSVKYLKN